MKVQFEWQVGSQDDEIETLARIGYRARRKWPWWIWAVIAFVLISAASGGYVIIRRRYEAAQARIRFQIQSVIDQEARAYAERDKNLFLAQQDRESTTWYRQQSTRISTDCFQSAALANPDSAGSGLSADDCQPVLAARVDEVDLQGDVAWVAVIEDEPAVRRVRFYRNTELGWKHTAPRVDFWDIAIRVNYGDALSFRYHRRDDPYATVLVEHMADQVGTLCGVIICPFTDTLEINFVVENVPRAPRFEDNVLILPSPWLSGMSPDGEPTQEQLGELTYTLTYELTSFYVRELTGQDLNLLQQAVIDEYAVWRSTIPDQDAPLVRRLVEQNGAENLPAILRSLEQVQSLNLLLSQWLGISAIDEPVAYFEALLNLEQESMLAGRRSTFLLLQDDSSSSWVAQQEMLFQVAQNEGLLLPPVQVEEVGIDGDLAQVTLENASHTSYGPEGIVFFQRRSGDWKHTAPPQAQGLDVPPIQVADGSGALQGRDP